jgi:hypothetical protein
MHDWDRRRGGVAWLEILALLIGFAGVRAEAQTDRDSGLQRDNRRAGHVQFDVAQQLHTQWTYQPRFPGRHRSESHAQRGCGMGVRRHQLVRGRSLPPLVRSVTCSQPCWRQERAITAASSLFRADAAGCGSAENRRCHSRARSAEGSDWNCASSPRSAIACAGEKPRMGVWGAALGVVAPAVWAEAAQQTPTPSKPSIVQPMKARAGTPLSSSLSSTRG